MNPIRTSRNLFEPELAHQTYGPMIHRQLAAKLSRQPQVPKTLVANAGERFVRVALALLGAYDDRTYLRHTVPGDQSYKADVSPSRPFRRHPQPCRGRRLLHHRKACTERTGCGFWMQRRTCVLHEVSVVKPGAVTRLV